MEQAFNLLKSQGKNSTEGVIQILKGANVITDGNTESIVRQVLRGVADPSNVNYSEFMEAVKAVAASKGFNLENLGKSLAGAFAGQGGTSQVGVAETEESGEGDSEVYESYVDDETFDDDDDDDDDDYES